MDVFGGGRKALFCLPHSLIHSSVTNIYSWYALCVRFGVTAVTKQIKNSSVTAPAVLTMKLSSFISFVVLPALEIPTSWALEGANKEKAKQGACPFRPP